MNAPKRPEWRCFFCDEVFTNPGEAADHFGATLNDQPGCLIDYRVQLEAGTNTQRGRGLLMALRRAEEELRRYGSEDTDLHRHMHRMESDHRQALIREEERGYARGLRAGANLPADSQERQALTAPYTEAELLEGDRINSERKREQLTRIPGRAEVATMSAIVTPAVRAAILFMLALLAALWGDVR